MTKPEAPLVIVDWDDAHGLAPDDERTDEQIDEIHAPYRFHTTGWLLRHDDTGATIANEWTAESDGKISYRGITFIPAGMIRKITGRRKAAKKSTGQQTGSYPEKK